MQPPTGNFFFYSETIDHNIDVEKREGEWVKRTVKDGERLKGGWKEKGSAG